MLKQLLAGGPSSLVRNALMGSPLIMAAKIDTPAITARINQAPPNDSSPADVIAVEQVQKCKSTCAEPSDL